MGKLSDVQIRAWVASGERFDQRGDGDGLLMSFRTSDAAPRWLFRYRFAGKQRVLFMGRYPTLTLAEARKEARLLAARVRLGHDVAGEKQGRKREALALIEAEKQKTTVAMVVNDYFEQMIAPRWKRPKDIRQRFDKNIVPNLGKLEVGAVKAKDVDAMLRKVMKRGAPSIANDTLAWTKRIFDYAVKRELCEYNPAARFDVTDAGGVARARDRALSRSELVTLFKAMRETQSFGRENALAVKLLLMLAVRKNELLAAKWSEFDLDAAVWHLSRERTKTDADIAVPLPRVGIDALRELQTLACGSDYVFPARKPETRRLGHIGESTLNMALLAVEKNMPQVPHFTVHDLRRTARTQLAALGVPPHVAEKCLNHTLKGIEGIYDRYDYFQERKEAFEKWAALLVQLEGGGAEVIPLHEKRSIAG